MKNILFVDDEPHVLEALERMLFPLRKEWCMKFAIGGSAALEIMEKQPFDLIVTDMRMAGMDGATLLTEVMNRYPQTVRFVLSGQSDKETVLRSVGPTHQYLAKPCDAKTLKMCVDRALILRDSIQSDSVKRLTAQMGSLPPLPMLYSKLVNELRSPEPSISQIGRIIQDDMAMTAKILQMVNSAFFGLRQHVSSAVQAVSLLGLETIKPLTLMVGIFAQVDKRRLPVDFSLESLWMHSMRVGAYSQAICKAENAPKDILNDAFSAGLLHDSGMLVLASGCPREYERIIQISKSSNVEFRLAEQTLFDCTHAEVGAYLLGIWGLPNTIVEAVAFHHTPELSPAEGFTPLIATHVANSLAHELVDAETDEPSQRVNLEYLEKQGLMHRLETWKEVCQEIDRR